MKGVLRRDDSGIAAVIIIGVILIIAVLIIVAVLVFAGIFTGPVNNPCPSGECGNGSAPVPFSITFMGYVVNPTWGTLYATVQANGPSNQPCGAACGMATGIVMTQSSGAPGASLKPVKWDFWTNNYELSDKYVVTYPSGKSYSFSFGKIDGTVGGSSQAAWSQIVYGTGPHGTYTITITLNYAQTGCNGGCSVAGQAVATTSATI